MTDSGIERDAAGSTEMRAFGTAERAAGATARATVATAGAAAGAWYVRTIGFDGAASLLRAWLGAMGVVHGYGKVFGGMERFTTGVAKMGFPSPEFFAWSAGLTELAGGALLILGLGTRPVALLMAITMAAAGFIRHADDPFKSKELALTYLVVSVVVFLMGPGRYSLDSLLAGRRRA